MPEIKILTEKQVQLAQLVQHLLAAPALEQRQPVLLA